MRVTSMLSTMQYLMQNSAQDFSEAEEQLATGLRVNSASDDPIAAAQYVANMADLSRNDYYTTNASSALSRLQVADSALSSVVTTLTAAISIGTQGANSTNNSTDLEGLAEQVEGYLDTVVSLANTSYEGAYLFAGTASDQVPFVLDSGGSGYVYQGNSGVNQVQVGNTKTVNANVAGDEIFGSGTGALDAMQQLVDALRSGTTADINAAVTAVSDALDNVNTARVPIGNTMSQLETQETYLGNEKVTLTSRGQSLVKIDLTEAATNVSQTELVNSATLSAAAKSMSKTLFDYM